MSRKQTKGYEVSPAMKAALEIPPVEFLREWWKRNSTEEERASAEERGATPEGAYSFIESVARKNKHGSGSCLPDRLVYDIVGMFMRNGADGDEFVTQEELDKRNHEREVEEAEMRAAQEDAERKEAERVAALTPEERAEEERVKAERALKEKVSEAERKEREAMRAAKVARIERAKAIAAEMKSRQLTFNF